MIVEYILYVSLARILAIIVVYISERASRFICRSEHHVVSVLRSLKYAETFKRIHKMYCCLVECALAIT